MGLYKYRLKPDGISAQQTTQDVTMLIATWAVGYGLVTVIGGAPIWRVPAYRTALMVPYSPESWAIVLIFIGFSIFIAMHIGSRKLMFTGLILGGAWNLFFAMSFLIEFYNTHKGDGPSEGIGLGPTVTYLLISGVFLLRVNTYRSKNAAEKSAP